MSAKTPKPVVFVQVGDDSKPVRFGFNALADFCDAAGLSLADLQALDLTALGLRELLALYWAGFKDGARKEGEPFAESIEDVGDWMDEIEDAESQKILEAFAGAQGAATDSAADGAGEPPGKPKPKKPVTKTTT